MTKFIVGADSDGIFQALHDAGVFTDDPKDVRRVVIDLEAGSAARVFIDRFVDHSFVDVLFGGGIEIVERENPVSQEKSD